MTRKALTGVRLDPELKLILRQVAEDDQRSLSYIVNEACWYWVERKQLEYDGKKRVTTKPPRKGATDEC